jgi:hypothetical protein
MTSPGHEDTGVTDVMVCVYYRVAAPELAAVIATVRDIQRGITRDDPGVAAELLLRSDHFLPGDPAPPTAPAAAPPNKTADPTLMETYRLDARTTEPRLDAFLARLAALAQPLAPRLRGDRHVEVFRPCAS